MDPKAGIEGPSVRSSAMPGEQDENVEFDIDEREAEIIGKPQRISGLGPDEFDANATALVVSLRQSLGLGTANIPRVFGLMLRHPGLFRCQIEMGIQLFKGEISPRERELAILRVGWWCRAPFEWGEHVDIAKRCGVTSEEVGRVKRGSSAPGWTEHERAILRAVEELLGNQMICDATWEALAQSWSERQLIEFPMMVGQYFATALQQNSLRVRLNDENVGLKQR
jgi:4-carboxymuconolactone decarboxylase